MVSMEASTIYLTGLYNAKANYHHNHSRINPEVIPAGTDLNDLTLQKSYFTGSNSTAETLINCPTDKSFHLEVYQHSGVRQVLYTASATNVATYERNYNDGIWSDWKQLQYAD